MAIVKIDREIKVERLCGRRRWRSVNNTKKNLTNQKASQKNASNFHSIHKMTLQISEHVQIIEIVTIFHVWAWTLCYFESQICLLRVSILFVLCSESFCVFDFRVVLFLNLLSFLWSLSHFLFDLTKRWLIVYWNLLWRLRFSFVWYEYCDIQRRESSSSCWEGRIWSPLSTMLHFLYTKHSVWNKIFVFDWLKIWCTVFSVSFCCFVDLCLKLDLCSVSNFLTKKIFYSFFFNRLFHFEIWFSQTWNFFVSVDKIRIHIYSFLKCSWKDFC